MSAPKVAQNVRQGLSRTESTLLSSLSGKRRKIFNLKDIMTELGCSYVYAKEIAKSLLAKKWIIGLRRGIYLIVPLSAGVESKYTEHEFVIGSYIVSPYYIAYWSALNFYNMTEQTPFTVFLATTKRPKSNRTRIVLDTQYKLVTLSKKKFFGFSSVAIGSDMVNISDREKTIADALDHPEYCGGMEEVAKCLWNATRDSISIEKVVNYAQKMDNSTIIKRLGYLLDVLEIRYNSNNDEDNNTNIVYSKMKDAISSGMSIFDPTRSQRKGAYNTKWNLIINISKDSLTRWREEY